MTAAKIAGAPISWGVCEVPGWGYQLSPERVLAEMRHAGLPATELGPAGFLPADPGALTALLGEYGLRCVGTFAPVLLHDADHDPVRSGELTYTEAVAKRMYTPLGTGDVDIAGIVAVLRDNGFDGWFVLEQDTILDGEPADEGPVRDVLASVAYLRDVLRA